MHVTLVHVHVKADRVEQFIEATRANHEASTREPGNLRFDVLRSAEDPRRFVIYEAYASEQDAAAHKKTGHYAAWREAVADWMASPRKGIVHHGLFPADRSGW